MKRWIQNYKTKLSRRLIVPAIAVATAVSMAGYELAKPVSAAVAAPAPAAAALDDNSVGALLSLDRAMEALAARVTPAIVNVTVASKSNAKMDEGEGPEGMQQFNPFGRQFGLPMQPQRPQIEHGLGSGVIISPDGYIVTNNHVVDGAVNVSVTLNDRRILPAKVVGTDSLTDLAVIKVNASDLPSV